MKNPSSAQKSTHSCMTMEHKELSSMMSTHKPKQSSRKQRKKQKNLYPLPRERQNTQKISKQFKQLLQKQLDQKRLGFLKRNFSEYYGKNFACQYKQQYRFLEQWEESLKKSEKLRHEDINNLNHLEIALIFMLIISYIATLWFGNIHFFFGEGEISLVFETVYLIAIPMMVVDCIFKFKYLQQRKGAVLGVKLLLRINYKQMCSILYLILKICNVMQSNSSNWMLELVFSYFMFVRINELYEMIRFLKLRLYHTYQSKIMDLIVLLLVILHIVAIILFCATRSNYQKTWLTEIKSTIQPLNEFTFYLYAFYFGTTTILTVGYGDITAQNPIEVGVVILIQIIGILTFSYLINEIGYSISTLRKGREVIENDLSVLQKMKKHYNMKDDLANQARNFLIHHKPNSNLLEPTTENNILQKFNESLRNDIVASNNLGIVKSSLFFLTKWTNSFQRSIASKLIHRLFPPHDLIYQPCGNERIYIFKTGKVHIYAQRNGHKKDCDNTLKVIDCKKNRDVSDNCYGYTAVISKRPSRLQAYSKDFTSSYFVDKQTFLNVVQHRVEDSQLYHQIMTRMDSEKCSEAYQAPLLQSSRHHYKPTISNLIRRYTKSLAEYANARCSSFKRNSARHYNIKKHMQYDESFEKLIRDKYNSKEGEVQQFPEDSLTSNQSSLANFVIHSIDQLQISDRFQIGKEFRNYFKNHNLEVVIRKIELKTPFLYQKQDCFLDKNRRFLEIGGASPKLRITLQKDKDIQIMNTQDGLKI